MEISSESNPSIKKYIKIAKGKFEEKDNIPLPVEGYHLIKEALKKGFFIKEFFYCKSIVKEELLDELMEKIPENTLKTAVSENVLKKITETENPQGVAALVDYPMYDAKEILSGEKILAVVVDRLQDPGNFGTIIRTAAAAGFEAVFFTPGTVRINNPKVLRSTAGAIFHIKVLATASIKDFCEGMISKKAGLVIAESSASKDYFEVNYGDEVFLVIGNENKGISSDLHYLNPERVRIPLCRDVDSINAAVAAGIIIYEIRRQIIKKTGE